MSVKGDRLRAWWHEGEDEHGYGLGLAAVWCLAVIVAPTVAVVAALVYVLVILLG